MTNPWCEALGLTVPALEKVKDHPEASAFTLLIVALLERGGPLTLSEAADRFAKAGVAPYHDALRSLQRCRPARPPVYRDGDRYALDPHDHDAPLWTFRLGLRPPRVPRQPPPVPAEPPPLPGPEVPLEVAELDEAWREASLYSWSARRVALSVLDAHRRPLAVAEIVAFVAARTKWHLLRESDAAHWGRGAPMRALSDGRWEVEPGDPALRAARKAVRDRRALVRRWAAARPDPAVFRARMRAFEEERAAHGAELARLRRVLVHAFPPEAPRAVVLVDVGAREATTYDAPDLPRVRERLDGFDVIVAVGVRPLLRALDYDPGRGGGGCGSPETWVPWPLGHWRMRSPWPRMTSRRSSVSSCRPRRIQFVTVRLPRPPEPALAASAPSRPAVADSRRGSARVGPLGLQTADQPGHIPLEAAGSHRVVAITA